MMGVALTVASCEEMHENKTTDRDEKRQAVKERKEGRTKSRE